MRPDVHLHPGDNRKSLAALPENSVDAVVTDPPYSLTSITKRFGKAGSAPARTEKNDGSFARVSGGFMGKAWDATGIERDPEFWAAILRVLKPGGFVFAFSGARTGHWQACAMEKAGFIMHPMHPWIYGTGFPKGHAVDTAIAGEQWAGWKYGTQTQKPAAEPIYLGQKPYDGKPVESILKWGVGAFNIDGCRVPGVKDVPASPRRAAQRATYGDLSNDPGTGSGWDPNVGRYPANLFHDGSDVVVALFPQTTTNPGRLKSDAKQSDVLPYAPSRREGTVLSTGDSGSAARFFHAFPADEFPWPTGFYHAKASSEDRVAHLVDKNAGEKPHPTVKPVGLLRNMIRHICPPGGTVLDPFAGTGTTAAAALAEGLNCIIMEAEEEYIAFLRRRFDLVSDGWENGEADLLDPPIDVSDLLLTDSVSRSNIAPFPAAIARFPTANTQLDDLAGLL